MQSFWFAWQAANTYQGINSNYGDTCTLKNVCTDASNPCVLYNGCSNGCEPSKVGYCSG